MRKLLLAVVSILLIVVVSCGKKGDESATGLPSDFTKMNDEQRMAYMMRKADPDSVARFLCAASLGKVPGAKIDTLPIAYLYALEHYRGEDSDRFGMAFELALKELSLSDKMHTQFALGLADTLQVGYELGLGYVGQIRSSRMTIKDIDKELAEFKQTCGNDTATYRRFIKGFKTALAVDSGKDLSMDVYRKYISMPER